MSFLIFSVIAFAVIAAASTAIIYCFLIYKPKQVTYLSPEALSNKRAEIESIRLDAIEKAYSQEDIDDANEKCDALYELYKLKRR